MDDVAPQGLSAESLSELVYTRLRRSLMRADLKPHQRIKVREMALQMGTSETPVREALMQLARDGAVEIKPRHYIRIRRTTAAEFIEIRDIRLVLEPMAAEHALAVVKQENIDQLEIVHERLVEAEESGNWTDALNANFEFHFGLYSLAPKPALLDILERLWLRIGPVLSELYPHAKPVYPGRHQHLNVLDALRARDSLALSAAIRMDLVEGGSSLAKHLVAIESRRTA